MPPGAPPVRGACGRGGFELAADQVAPLQDLLEQAFHDQVGLEPPRPTLRVDAQAELLELDRAFNRHLETFGPSAPEPGPGDRLPGGAMPGAPG